MNFIGYIENSVSKIFVPLTMELSNEDIILQGEWLQSHQANTLTKTLSESWWHIQICPSCQLHYKKFYEIE
jgi:hypothetical protein